jgi:hypothetical protein
VIALLDRAYSRSGLGDRTHGLVTRIRPGVIAGTSPLRMCRSVPQMVVEVIRTIASLSSTILGSGTSSQFFCPGPWKTTACIANLLLARLRLA